MNAHVTAKAIATYLVGWHAETSPAYPGAGPSETLVRVTRLADGAFVILSLDGERFEITAGWPAYADGTRYRPDRHLKIGVSAKKSAEAMAGEIERRLLPDYLPAYAKALSEIKGREAEQATARACAEMLAKIVGTSVEENGRGGFGLYALLAPSGAHPSLPECIRKVHVRTGCRVNIELTDLDELTAARILTLLQRREVDLLKEEKAGATQQGREEEH